MKTKSKKTIQKYFFICYFFGFLFIALWSIVCFTIQNNIIKILSLLLFLIVLNVIIRIVANKTIASVLFVELDAIEFHELIKNKKFLPSIDFLINAAIFTGDYQTAINIATNQIKKKDSIRTKHLYLCVLAQAYFELRDFEKIQILLKKHKEYVDKYPSKKFFRASNSIWSYYQYFLEHNYEACKNICNERSFKLKSKTWNAKIRKLQNDFFYAIACYENGDIDEAKKNFEAIVFSAPRMNYTNLSEKYIEAIKRKQQVALFDVEILPDLNFQIYDIRTKTRIKNFKLIKKISISVVAILFITSSVFNAFDIKKENNSSIFEKKLNQTVIKYYDNAIILDYFNLYKEEKFVIALGLIAENSCIHLVEICSYDNGQTFDIFLIKENIVFEKKYCLKSYASDYYIGFVISKNKITDAHCTRKLKIRRDNYFFIVDYIEKSAKTE